MATVSKGRTFVSGETVTPAKLNELVDNATVTSIVDADISASAAIASSKLSTAAQQALIPAGAIMPFAMNSAPSGWLAANGDAVSRSTYAALFSAIGTVHGSGDGSTTFNLPNLQGIFVRGSGGPHSIGSGGEAYSATFAAKQTDAMQGHQHAITSNAQTAVVGSVYAGGSGATLVSATISVGNPTTDGANGTPRTAVETRPANIALLYCIKF